MLDMYLGYDPSDREGRENLKRAGYVRGQDVARFDHEAHEIITDTEVLRELARREFVKWWNEEKRKDPGFHKEDPNSLDAEQMQRLFTPEFREAYRVHFDRLKDSGYRYHISAFEERVLPPLPAGPTARVINTRRSHDPRLYELELVDPDYPADRISFEVQVDSHGETELRERT
jgi:hypothetical protein